MRAVDWLLPTRWSAGALRRLHGCIALGTLAFTPYASTSDLRRSVPFLVAISMGALVLSEFGAWQAARAEEAGDDAEQVAQAVLDRLRDEYELVPRSAAGRSSSVGA